MTGLLREFNFESAVVRGSKSYLLGNFLIANQCTDTELGWSEFTAEQQLTLGVLKI